MDTYYSINEISQQWTLSSRRVQYLCSSGKIDGAIKVGNNWLIPKLSQKPANKTSSTLRNTFLVSDRKQSFCLLKELIKKIFSSLNNLNESKSINRLNVISILGAYILKYFVNSNVEESYKEICRLLRIKSNSKIFSKIAEYKYIENFLRDNDGIIDLAEILSWSYEFTNSKNINNCYKDTQFFTEHYMTNFLINELVGISNKSDYIYDPCCGGGNFLIKYIDCYIESLNSGNENIGEYITELCNKIYGYEIDNVLGIICSINIKFKFLDVLKRMKHSISFDDWNNLKTNIYIPNKESLYGSLDFFNKTVIVTNAITKESLYLSELCSNKKVIATNPPFKTVKNMDEDLKQYLKNNYKDCNCDLCVSFLKAIYEMLPSGGSCGIVVQNSWLFLDSFLKIKQELLSEIELYCLAYLGANAFLELNGEKTNVSLIVFSKPKIRKDNNFKFIDLSTKSYFEKIENIHQFSKKSIIVQQEDLINSRSGFSFISNEILNKLINDFSPLSTYAVPMQGTSTGNTAELVDYFWNHFNDSDWKLVSKGGSYCKWAGLNNYVVKWGKDGEYIKQQKGSAIRNSKFFNSTQLVYCDTGTAGLNVRILRENELFIASGPGIRINDGNPYSILAYLNSRVASYFIKSISPKLTVSAGYISKLPIPENIRNSDFLSNSTLTCISLKEKFLQNRVTNYEYNSKLYNNFNKKNLDECAWNLFILELQDELLKLQIESQMDTYILNELNLSDEERSVLDSTIGECRFNIKSNKIITNFSSLDDEIEKLLDSNCELKRTKIKNAYLGCDGLLEYLASYYQINPDLLVRCIIQNGSYFIKTRNLFKNLILHNEVLNNLGYSPITGLESDRISLSKLTNNITNKYSIQFDFSEWLKKDFPIIHSNIFKKKPVLNIEMIEA